MEKRQPATAPAKGWLTFAAVACACQFVPGSGLDVFQAKCDIPGRHHPRHDPGRAAMPPLGTQLLTWLRGELVTVSPVLASSP